MIAFEPRRARRARRIVVAIAKTLPIHDAQSLS